MAAIGPPYVAPVLALVSCVVSGLTAFGQGILFLVLWSILGVVGVLDESHPDFITSAVLLSAVLSLAPLPYLAWVARFEMRDNLGWAVVLGLPTCALTPLGVAFLRLGNVAVLKGVTGALFATFGAVKLFLSLREEALLRQSESAARAVSLAAMASPFPTRSLSGRKSPAPTAAPDDRSLQLDASTVDTTSIVVPSAAVVAGDSGAVNASSEQDDVRLVSSAGSRLSDALERWFPPISDDHSLRFTTLALGLAGVASGVLGGMLGVGGPPQIVAFAVLRLHKTIQRGLVVAVGLVSSIMRIVTLVTSPGIHVYSSDWPVIVGVAVGAVVGTSIGTYFRVYVHTETILRWLYGLLILSTVTMFNLVRHVSGLAVFFVFVAGYAGLLVLLWRRPRVFTRAPSDSGKRPAAAVV